MDKDQTKNAFVEIERLIIQLYTEIEACIGSKRGIKFQFMMMHRSFSAILNDYAQLREKYLGKEEIVNPLDALYK